MINNGPKWYSRETIPSTTTEWQTWQSESNFCAMENRQLCTYEQLCPQGQGTIPANFALTVADKWAAVAGSPTFVSLGSHPHSANAVCATYAQLFNQEASWATNWQGTGPSENFEFIACCPSPPSPPTAPVRVSKILVSLFILFVQLSTRLYFVASKWPSVVW